MLEFPYSTTAGWWNTWRQVLPLIILGGPEAGNPVIILLLMDWLKKKMEVIACVFFYQIYQLLIIFDPGKAGWFGATHLPQSPKKQILSL